MAKLIEVKVSGLSELEDRLERAPLRVAKNIMRSALKSAAEIWATSMAARVIRGPHQEAHGATEFGAIAKDIHIRVSVKSDLEGTAAVGPGPNSYWARFVEFGTRLRHRGKITGYARSQGKRLKNRGGGSTGTMPPFPFMRPAFEEEKGAVLEKFSDGVRQALDEEGLF